MNLAILWLCMSVLSVKFLRRKTLILWFFYFPSFLHVFAKFSVFLEICESRNNFLLVKEWGAAKTRILPSLLMNPSFKSQMLYIIKPNWADYQENSVIQGNKRERSLFFMKEELMPRGGWNVKNAFSAWIFHINCPVSVFFPFYLRLGISITLVQWVYVAVFCRTWEDLNLWKPRSMGLFPLCRSPA